MEPDKVEEPIFDLASECERLFASQVTKLQDCDEQNGAKLLLDLNQRFLAWAAFLGVFAESNVCLDRKLRHHVEIQDQVLLLLDIMRRNLAYCIVESFTERGAELTAGIVFDSGQPSDDMDVDSNYNNQLSSNDAKLSISSLEAISEAVDRLNHLGVAIRQSSVVSQATKARAFAENFDLNSFERVAYLSLQTLYSDASQGLLEQLARSMTETYARFLHRKSRQGRLQARRPRAKITNSLYAIVENQALDADEDMQMSNTVSSAELNTDVSIPTTQFPRPQISRVLPLSEPTSIDSQEVRTRFKKLLNPSIKSKTMSILANQVDYPRPAKGSLVCDWCFTPISVDSVDGAQWRKHINEDNEPYVCVSEKCSETLPKFATSTQWFQHMLQTHGDKWHQEVHAPSSWVCPLCTDEEAAFSKSYDLTAHLEQVHEGIFTEPQIQAITNQSRFRAPRPRGNCPLCCLPIRGEGADLSKEPEHENSEIDNSRLSRDPASSNMPSFELIGSHVAAHLQSIMLLALRLISIDVAVDVSNDSESATNGTEDRSSWTGSGQAGLGENLKDLTTFSNYDDEDGYKNDEMSTGSDQIMSEAVPETEYIDWDYVSLRFENDIDKSNGKEAQEPAIHSSDIQPLLAKTAISEQDSDKPFPSIFDSTNLDIKETPRTPQWDSDHVISGLLNDTSVKDFLRDSSPESGESYICLLCDSPKVLHVEAAFESHVKEQHQNASFFKCKLCSFKDIREDGLRSHVWEVHSKSLQNEEISSCEVMGPLPTSCKICVSQGSQFHHSPFQSWHSWFEGIKSHCVLYLKRRQRLIKQLILNEQTFERDMRIIQDIYRGTVHACTQIDSADIKILFGSYNKVLRFSSTFLNSLKRACYTVNSIPDSQDHDDDKSSSLSDFEADQQTSVGQTFMEHISSMEEVFGSYMKGHDASQRKLGILTNYLTVNVWLNECRESISHLTSAPELRVLLDRPQSRLVFYRMVLSTLAKLTTPVYPDRAAIIMALGYVTKMPERIRDTNHRMNVVAQMLAPTEPQSGLRAGISKIFNFRADRSGPEASPNLISIPDDITYTLSTRELGEKFRNNYFYLQVMIRDFKEYKTYMRAMLDSFKNLVLSFIDPIDTVPPRFTEIREKWRYTDICLEGTETVLYHHTQSIESTLLDPILFFERVYEKYAIALREHQKLSRDSSKRIGERFRMDEKSLLSALDTTLKDELPKLFLLTDKFIEAFLGDFVETQETWYRSLEEKLKEVTGIECIDVQDILDDWRANILIPVSEFDNLGICNGSILDSNIAISPTSPARDSKDYRGERHQQEIMETSSASDSVFLRDVYDSLATVGRTSESGAAQSNTDAGSDNPSSNHELLQSPQVLFLATSLFEFNIERTHMEAGFPYLTYVTGEIFDVLSVKGELWLAMNQDDPDGRVGWVWEKHFAKIASSDSRK